VPNAKAAERFFEFFTARIGNKNTRRAYYKAVCRFWELQMDVRNYFTQGRGGRVRLN